jgi:hypothetical protein
MTMNVTAIRRNTDGDDPRAGLREAIAARDAAWPMLIGSGW